MATATNSETTPVPPIETQSRETEQDLVQRARTSVSECNWTVGECAATWTQRYARGRTDADFGALISMSGDQVNQRRRVWETFGDVRSEYPSLRWSHFYVSLTWDDAPECLAWARDNEATVAEMKAWRRLQHGEDLTQPAAEEVPPWEDESAVAFVPEQPTPVRDPSGESESSRPANGNRPSGSREPVATATGVARDSGGSDDSASSGASESGEPRTAAAPKPDVSVEQIVKRMTSAVERVNKALTKELIDALPDVPRKVRNRFVKAVGELSAKAAKLA